MSTDPRSVRDQVLEYLKGKSPQLVADIAHALQKEPTNLHRIVHDLTDCGLVRCESRPADKARVYSLIPDDFAWKAQQVPAAAPASPPAPPPVRTAVPAPVRPPVTRAPAPKPRKATTAKVPSSQPPAAKGDDDPLRKIQQWRRDSEILQRIRALLAGT